MSEKPHQKFSPDIEMLKITLLSDDLRTRAFTRIGFYFSFYVALAVGAIAVLLQIIGDRLEFSAFGIAFTLGIFYMGWLVRGSAIEYYKQLGRIGELISRIEKGETIGEFEDLVKKFIGMPSVRRH
jgi:hypothetical protein